jgi:hypothetical protein
MCCCQFFMHAAIRRATLRRCWRRLWVSTPEPVCGDDFQTAVRDDQQSAFFPDLLLHFFAALGLVCRDGQLRSGLVQYLFEALTVVRLSACYPEAQRPAFAINNRLDFRSSGTRLMPIT